MNIAKIWHDDYPWDVRVEKICKALIEDGHNVHLICRNIAHKPTEETMHGIHIHRLFPLKNKTLNKVSSIVAFFNPVWIKKIYQVVRQEKIDAILVRDLPLAISALIVGRRLKIPVVFDMAENYPSMWKDHVDKKGIKAYNHILKNTIVAILMENFVVKKVDHIIVVIEESKNRIFKKGIDCQKISIVSNTPDFKSFIPNNPSQEPNNNDKLNMLYVGNLDGGRD